MEPASPWSSCRWIVELTTPLRHHHDHGSELYGLSQRGTVGHVPTPFPLLCVLNLLLNTARRVSCDGSDQFGARKGPDL